VSNERKPVKEGLDFVRDGNWNPVTRTRAGVLRLGRRIIPKDLKAHGFVPAVCDCGDYFRLSFGKLAPQGARR